MLVFSRRSMLIASATGLSNCTVKSSQRFTPTSDNDNFRYLVTSRYNGSAAFRAPGDFYINPSQGNHHLVLLPTKYMWDLRSTGQNYKVSIRESDVVWSTFGHDTFLLADGDPFIARRQRVLFEQSPGDPGLATRIGFAIEPSGHPVATGCGTYLHLSPTPASGSPLIVNSYGDTPPQPNCTRAFPFLVEFT